MKPIKVVFDTNIFISGLFWSGLPNRLWFLAKFGSFELLVSDPILKEIERSLTRKFSYNEGQKVRMEVVKKLEDITEKLTLRRRPNPAR
jgi:putative PIN family toxin of toxin-antitoxin system